MASSYMTSLLNWWSNVPAMTRFVFFTLPLCLCLDLLLFDLFDRFVNTANASLVNLEGER